MKFINEIKTKFNCIASVAEKFVCYLDDNGEERWCNDKLGIIGMDSEWAEKYIEEIADI